MGGAGGSNVELCSNGAGDFVHHIKEMLLNCATRAVFLE